MHRIIGGFRAKGVGIVYISYRLDEVFRIAGRMMVGRPLAAMFSARDKSNIGAEVLKVEKLNSGRRVRDVSFAVKAGEIVGLGGLVGSGRTEVARLIFGADIPDSGTITLKGKTIRPRSPKDTVAAGIGLVPEDRKLHGVVLDKPIRTNATMARMSAVVNPLGFLKTGHERRLVTELGRSLRLKVSSVDAPVASLSGGNQPKVVLAKWFHAGGDMIILDEPTRGVDAGAKTEICSVATIEGNWGPFVLLETGGDAMRWARRTFHEKSLSYQDIAAKAAEAPAGSDALFFLPYLTGERLGDHRNARAQFFGIGAGHGLAHLHRAVLEGVGFAAARHLRIMEKAAGRKLERVVASGGGARTTLWLKIKASIYGIPVVAPKEPECGIIGCAAMAVTATGRFAKPQDAVDSFVKYETEVQPDPAWSETYARMQPVFDRLYHHSQALYGDLDVLSS